jgi:hypothetical protein
MTASYIRSTNNFGAMYFGQVTVGLVGLKGEPKAQLMSTAVSVALDRLLADAPQAIGSNGLQIKDGMFEETGHENEVKVILRAIMANTPKQDNSKAVSAAAQAGGAGLIALPQILNPAAALYGLFKFGQTVKQIGEDLSKQDQQPNGQPAPPKPKPPAVAGIDPNRFTGRWTGCSVPPQTDGTFAPGAGIVPESLYGNLKQLRLIAAAFNDPCLGQTVLRSARNLQNVTPGKKDDGDPPPTEKDKQSLRSEPNDPPATAAVIRTIAQLPANMVTPVMAVFDAPGVWELCSIEMTYNYVENKAVLPSTVSGDSGALVQWCNPTCDLTVAWVHQKTGGKPTIPDWDDSPDGNLVCTEHHLTTEEVELAADGESLTYSVDGLYRYSALDPTQVKLRNACPPWLPLDLSKDDPYPATDTIIHGIAGALEQQTNTLRSQQR